MKSWRLEKLAGGNVQSIIVKEGEFSIQFTEFVNGEFVSECSYEKELARGMWKLYIKDGYKRVID